MFLHFALQLLGELADMCGPFQSTLLKLREALLPSIYSCCSGPSLYGSRPLQFDMLPWFALAGRLRRQNNQLLEQQAAFSLELTQHQVWSGLFLQAGYDNTITATLHNNTGPPKTLDFRVLATWRVLLSTENIHCNKFRPPKGGWYGVLAGAASETSAGACQKMHTQSTHQGVLAWCLQRSPVG